MNAMISRGFVSMVRAVTLQERTYAIVIQGTREARMESDAKVKMFYFISLGGLLWVHQIFCFNAFRYLVGLAGVALLCSTVAHDNMRASGFFGSSFTLWENTVGETERIKNFRDGKFLSAGETRAENEWW